MRALLFRHSLCKARQSIESADGSNSDQSGCKAGVRAVILLIRRQNRLCLVMPDLIRHPRTTWIPAFAGMTTMAYLIAGLIASDY
jgi:hypothetical protein